MGLQAPPSLPTWVYGLHKSHPSTHGGEFIRVCALLGFLTKFLWGKAPYKKEMKR